MQIRLKQDTPTQTPQGVFVVIPANTLLTPMWYGTYRDGEAEWFVFHHPEYLHTNVLSIHIEKIYPRPTYWTMIRTDGLIACVNEVSKTLDQLTHPNTNLTQDMRDTALVEAYQHLQYLVLQMSIFAKQYPLPPVKEGE